jgi:hypothetical protein
MKTRETVRKWSKTLTTQPLGLTKGFATPSSDMVKRASFGQIMVPHRQHWITLGLW